MKPVSRTKLNDLLQNKKYSEFKTLCSKFNDDVSANFVINSVCYHAYYTKETIHKEDIIRLVEVSSNAFQVMTKNTHEKEQVLKNHTNLFHIFNIIGEKIISDLANELVSFANSYQQYFKQYSSYLIESTVHKQMIEREANIFSCLASLIIEGNNNDINIKVLSGYFQTLSNSAYEQNETFLTDCKRIAMSLQKQSRQLSDRKLYKSSLSNLICAIFFNVNESQDYVSHFVKIKFREFQDNNATARDLTIKDIYEELRTKNDNLQISEMTLLKLMLVEITRYKSVSGFSISRLKIIRDLSLSKNGLTNLYGFIEDIAQCCFSTLNFLPYLNDVLNCDSSKNLNVLDGVHFNNLIWQMPDIYKDEKFCNYLNKMRSENCQKFADCKDSEYKNFILERVVNLWQKAFDDALPSLEDVNRKCDTILHKSVFDTSELQLIKALLYFWKFYSHWLILQWKSGALINKMSKTQCNAPSEDSEDEEVNDDVFNITAQKETNLLKSLRESLEIFESLEFKNDFLVSGESIVSILSAIAEILSLFGAKELEIRSRLLLAKVAKNSNQISYLSETMYLLPQLPKEIRNIAEDISKNINYSKMTVEQLNYTLGTAWGMYERGDTKYSCKLVPELLNQFNKIQRPKDKKPLYSFRMFYGKLLLMLAKLQRSPGSLDLVSSSRNHSESGPLELGAKANEQFVYALNIISNISSHEFFCLIERARATKWMLSVKEFLSDTFRDLPIPRQMRQYSKEYIHLAQKMVLTTRTSQGLLFLTEHAILVDDEEASLINLRSLLDIHKSAEGEKKKISRGVQLPDATSRSILPCMKEGMVLKDPSSSPGLIVYEKSNWLGRDIPAQISLESFSSLPLWFKSNCYHGVTYHLKKDLVAAAFYFQRVENAVETVINDTQNICQNFVFQSELNGKVLCKDLYISIFNCLQWIIECYGRDRDFNCVKRVLQLQKLVAKRIDCNLHANISVKICENDKILQLIEDAEIKEKFDTIREQLGKQASTSICSDVLTTPSVTPKKRTLKGAPMKKRVPALANLIHDNSSKDQVVADGRELDLKFQEFLIDSQKDCSNSIQEDSQPESQSYSTPFGSELSDQLENPSLSTSSSSELLPTPEVAIPKKKILRKRVPINKEIRSLEEDVNNSPKDFSKVHRNDGCTILETKAGLKRKLVKTKSRKFETVNHKKSLKFDDSMSDSPKCEEISENSHATSNCNTSKRKVTQSTHENPHRSTRSRTLKNRLLM